MIFLHSFTNSGIILGLTYLGTAGVSYKVAGVFILVLATGFVLVAIGDIAALTQVYLRKDCFGTLK